jgi:cation diffusion facilitator CzcD-associated flavoprotein CzcO
MLAACSAAPGDATVDVLIVGTGFAGLAMAIKLQEAGFPDVLLIEKAAEVGGTWRDNTYPGCACDIPSHLYSLSFAQKADWSRMYPQQPELLAYLRGVAAQYGLPRRIRFNTAFHGASWDEASGRWHVDTSTGRITARVLISGAGGLHIPAFPQIPGLEGFSGAKFHSAEWDHGVSLEGKRVAVIGTGASAIQFIPEIAPPAARLDVYQRTAAWVMPKADRPFTQGQKRLLGLPPIRTAFRSYLFWLHELRVLAFLGNKRAQRVAEKLAKAHLARQVADKDLRAKLTPDYTMGCKRVMISNDYYPALARPNVALITDRIAEIREHSIVDAAGAERPADVLIFGTGFEVTSAYRHTRITGIGGQELATLWDRTGMRAHQGVSVAGFPNYFMLLGPHSALGHNSVVLMIEAQAKYIAGLLVQLRQAGAGAAAVREEVQDRFVTGVEQRMRGTVWQDGGCASWYQDVHGKVPTIWPGGAASYQRALRAPDLRDYRLLGRATQTA